MVQSITSFAQSDESMMQAKDAADRDKVAMDTVCIAGAHPTPDRAVATDLTGNKLSLSDPLCSPFEPLWHRNGTQSGWSNIAYRPSTTPIANLESISLPELPTKMRHTGRVLFARILTPTARSQPLRSTFEDQALLKGRIVIYNCDATAELGDVLYHGALIAVREPFYTTSDNGIGAVQVVHPSDLITLHLGHPSIPAAFVAKLGGECYDPLALKMVGNKAYQDGKYARAVQEYTRGLTICSANDVALRRDLHRNRSIANFYMGYYEPAASDASLALHPAGDKSAKCIAENVKSLYRAARAKYRLQDFVGAESSLENLLKLRPEDQDGREQLRRTRARLKEAKTGEYNFRAMGNSLSLSHKHLDHANFMANVEVRSAGKKGRGLFTTKCIKHGSVVFVEKAISIAFASELGEHAGATNSSNTRIMCGSVHALAYNRLLHKMIHNPVQARRILNLYNGGYFSMSMAQVVDDVAAVDALQVAAIFEQNCFQCPNLRSSNDMDSTSPSGSSDTSIGLWTSASYMNHACDANALCSFMGDMMVVRATKDIAHDQQIFISYRSPEFDHLQTRRELERRWQFTCECQICSAEAQASSADLKERQRAIADLSVFFETSRSFSDAATHNAQTLYQRLAATYDPEVFASVPRIALIQLGSWLCAAYQSQNDAGAVITAAHSTLRDSGFQVELKDSSLKIDSTNCFSGGADIDVAMYAARECYSRGEYIIGKQYEAFARVRYLITNGELRNFDQRYL